MVGQAKVTRGLATLVVGAVLFTGSCSTNREVTRPDPVPVTDELLSESLLTEEDVPPPYVLDDDAEPLGPELLPEHECDDALSDFEPEDSASVTFTGTGLGTTLTNTISYFPGQGDSVNAAFVNLLSACKQAVVEDAALRFTTVSLDFGVLSDNTFPLRVVVENDDGTIEERNLIVMQSGDLISTIRLDGPRPTDLEVLDAVTRVAIGNLGEIAQET